MDDAEPLLVNLNSKGIFCRRRLIPIADILLLCPLVIKIILQ